MGSIGGSLALWLLAGFVYWEAPAEDWREERERLGHVICRTPPAGHRGLAVGGQSPCQEDLSI